MLVSLSPQFLLSHYDVTVHESTTSYCLEIDFQTPYHAIQYVFAIQIRLNSFSHLFFFFLQSMLHTVSLPRAPCYPLSSTQNFGPHCFPSAQKALRVHLHHLQDSDPMHLLQECAAIPTIENSFEKLGTPLSATQRLTLHFVHLFLMLMMPQIYCQMYNHY